MLGVLPLGLWLLELFRLLGVLPLGLWLLEL